jgi:DNA invertase Pin-like site-specific DNA recombinase
MKPSSEQPRRSTVRCAIYTRKSSEEGLEQAFNSLDAQREACAAYILSQASEGWTALAEVYDDGGLSGGTLERPALQRLLTDVAAGRIDIIVVYKVDRLTRSLLDFAKLVEAFDKSETSFVSVTQSFNTTTSMGRLTLNMLLSFAQFEREVTAERIRDKIAASKARGMWMGGTPPLGYAPDGRSLSIVEPHAALTRHIFNRYLELGNVRHLADELARTGMLSPERKTANGKTFGGRTFSRGQLYLMLKCVTYTGQIAHRGTIYPGLHPAIIDADTFARVQALLAEGVKGGRSAPRVSNASLLAGKIVDGSGEPLMATHAAKNTKCGKARYRYYVSQGLHTKTSASGMRIPAREIETLVVARTAELFQDPLELVASAWLDVPGQRYPSLHQACAELGTTTTSAQRAALAKLVERVQVMDARIEIRCSTQAIASVLDLPSHPDAPECITLSSEARLTRTGRALRLVHDDGSITAPAADQSLARLLPLARRWWSELRQGEVNIKQLAARESLSSSWVTRVVRLAFLSPEVVDAALTGGLRAGTDGTKLMLGEPVPPSWREQASTLLSGRPIAAELR